jgi:hypothetical protein
VATEPKAELQDKIGPASLRDTNGVDGKPITSIGLLDLFMLDGFASRGIPLSVAVRRYLPGGTPLSRTTPVLQEKLNVRSVIDENPVTF